MNDLNDMKDMNDMSRKNMDTKKRRALLIMLFTLPALLLSGCGVSQNNNGSAGTAGPASETGFSSETEDPGHAANTPEPAPTEKPTPVPDPSTVTLMIEDFNDITDVKKSLSPIDLSSFGIAYPEFSFDGEFAQEGVALVNTLSPAAWCQAFELTGKRLDVFDEAKDDYYLRIWVAVPDNSDVSLTFCLGSKSGKNRSYIDASKATVTDISGRREICDSGNASSDAGDDSSLRIQAGFCGYVALPLKNLLPWRGYQGIDALKDVNYLKIDARPSVTSQGDRYVLDALCISDSPVAQLIPGGQSGDDPGEGPVFDNKNEELDHMLSELINKEASFQYCPEYDPAGYPGIKAIWMDGVKYGRKDTKVFAYVGFPQGASGSAKVPGVVLMHGGGGYAYPNWVKLWNDRGYAAIAVCNTGYYPASTGITDFFSASLWIRSVPSEVLEKDPRIMPPDNDGMYSSTGSIDRMWMYHAVAQTILANNILRADDRVDNAKIGITGISWGGVITSVAIGYDSRFAFAVPVYGSGYLNEAHSWMYENFNSTGTKELWEPSLRLKDVKMPVLWLCWADDNCFSVNSNSKSLLDTENGVLSIIQDMNHGHFEGWGREEIYRFADSAVKGAQPLAIPKTLPGKGRDVSFEVSLPSDASAFSARVCYIDAPLSYSLSGRLKISGQKTIDQEWHFAECTISGNKVSVMLPDEAVSYYVELTVRSGGVNYISCTPFTDVN